MTSRSPADLPRKPNLGFEVPLWAAGLDRIAGLDEAGRGAWAGPVAAAVVVLPPEPHCLTRLYGVRDSKLMTPHQRALWAEEIRDCAYGWAVGLASPEEIDTIGILPATRLAMVRALQQLQAVPQHLLIDALFLPDIPQPQTALIKGDRRSLSIAAASVLAKTTRDALMIAIDEQHPGYGFPAHKGYGTAVHRFALQRLGPCAIHRKSFAPVRERITATIPVQMNGAAPF